MASITASTKHSVKVIKKKESPSVLSVGRGKTKTTTAKSSKASAKTRGGAPPLRPKALSTPTARKALRELQTKSEQLERVSLWIQESLGGTAVLVDKSAPHVASSTTRDRSHAAADVAVAAQELGVAFVLKECGLLMKMQQLLFPQGIEALIPATTTNNNNTLRPSASAVSLTSLDTSGSIATSANNNNNSIGTDTKRGKITPPTSREGCLLILRALCEIVGKPVEPYVVGAFLVAALDECGSSSSSIREAAEDSAAAMIKLANPWSFPRLLCPLLIQSLQSNEWRVKYNALQRLSQCATIVAPLQVQRLLPKLIPEITNQVWDTKLQVSKAAGSTLLAICKTNLNPDVASAIPAVVQAICKPSETNKAVQELMGTTFVASVDASTLSILCPVLARALKEKLALHKRSACIVISNMSRLVETPHAVAPFGPLLVPELQKVANNVQFEDIRDEALKALNNLTKALGDSYNATDEANKAEAMAEEQARVEAEQERIQQAKEAEKEREEELRQKEEEEKARFKQAMDAQRELDKLAEKEAEQKKQDDVVKREQQKLSTKGKGGKCQSCGLKKCKKSCLFYSG